MVWVCATQAMSMGDAFCGLGTLSVFANMVGWQVRLAVWRPVWPWSELPPKVCGVCQNIHCKIARIQPLLVGMAASQQGRVFKHAIERNASDQEFGMYRCTSCSMWLH